MPRGGDVLVVRLQPARSEDHCCRCDIAPQPSDMAVVCSDEFKALKQNLKIKTFVGTSANAVKTQIGTALISMPLLRYLQLSSRFGGRLAKLVALQRLNLFTHRDLMAWLDKPFPTLPDPQDNSQPFWPSHDPGQQ